MIKAQYTVVLKTLLDDAASNNTIQKALSTYPIYKPKVLNDMIPTREELNKKLLNNYKYREIGFETVGRFVDELEIVMNEIMPHYNELYKTIEIMSGLPSPFDNVDVIETFEETKTGTSNSNLRSTSESSVIDESSSNTTGTASDNGTVTSSTDSTTDSKNVRSTQPQGLLSIGTKAINNVNYADEAEWKQDINTATNNATSTNAATTSSDSSSNSTSNVSGDTQAIGTNENEETTKHTYTKKGNQGVNTYAHDMNEFRTSIIDVTNQIINDERIAELFMMIY